MGAVRGKVIGVALSPELLARIEGQWAGPPPSPSMGARLRLLITEALLAREAARREKEAQETLDLLKRPEIRQAWDKALSKAWSPKVRRGGRT